MSNNVFTALHKMQTRSSDENSGHFFGHFAFLSPPLAKLGTTYDVHLGLIGKRVMDFLLVLIELFVARCYG